MEDRSVKVSHSVREATPSGARLVLTVGLGACAALVWVVPRAAPTRELPPLVLDPVALAEVHARDAMLEVPTGELADRIRSGLADQGRAEVGEGEPEARFEARLSALRAAARELVEREGEDALDGLRAEALAELPRALAGELPREQEEALLGSFPRMLARYGAVRDGVVIAPQAVVRALFVARFDALTRGEPTARMTPVERQAYWGWIALAEFPQPEELRARALGELVRAGGWGAREAQAMAWTEAGATSAAERAWAALAADGNLRWRNAAIAAEL